MKEIKKYVAYDGTEFDSREECEEYEGEYLNYYSFLTERVVFYDRKRNPITIRDQNDFFRELELAYNDTYYIKLYEDMPIDTYSYIYNSIGVSLPRDAGDYRYDYNDSRWHSIDEDKKELAYKWGVQTFKQIFSGLP